MKVSFRVKYEIQIVCHMSCIRGSLFGFFIIYYICLFNIQFIKAMFGNILSTKVC